MKSVNTIKVMNEEQKIKDLMKADKSHNYLFYKKAYSFVENYILRKIKSIDIKEVIPKGEKIRSSVEKFYYEEMESNAVMLTILLAQVDFEENKSPLLLKDKEVGFLDSKDLTIKKDIGNRIFDIIYKKYTFENKVEEYFEKYLIPMLNKLNDNKIIAYDVNSEDKEIQLLTNKTTELVKLFINNKIGNCINFSLFKYAFNEEETYRFNFLYNDNENARNDFVEIVKDFLEDNYNKMELKTMSKETMEQYIEAVEK